MKLIFVVEDHDVVRRGVKSYLEMSDFQVMTFANLKFAEEALKTCVPDMIIQDVMLPDGDGFDFIARIKPQYNVPVVFMTAKISEEDRIRGFELGADDYIVKPFSLKELVLRVQAIFKRIDSEKSVPVQPAQIQKKVVKHCIYNLDKSSLEWNEFNYSTKVDGKNVELTAAERNILKILIDSDDAVSREVILKKCFDYSSQSYSRIVDTHIKNLRAKLGKTEWIGTIRGIGYRFLGRTESEFNT